ncbi:MAG: hypothetical protein ACRDJE_06935 [Dehalococcoidia bacterium]
MALDRSQERVRRDLIRLSHSGMAGRALLAEALARLRQVVPLEAFFAATVDPATVLFTESVGEGIPPAASLQFLANEFHSDDVNHFTDLARGPESVRSLYMATAGAPAESPRYRDIMAPIGLGATSCGRHFAPAGPAGACSASTASSPRRALPRTRPPSFAA